MATTVIAVSGLLGSVPAHAADTPKPLIVMNIASTTTAPQSTYVYDSVYTPGLTTKLVGSHLSVGGFEFWAPPGEDLHEGEYTHVLAENAAGPGHATAQLTIGSVAQWSNAQVGDVDITDLAEDAAGNIVRLALNFRYGVNTPYYSQFGEIRVGEPETPGRILTGHRLVWPLATPGASQVWNPEQVHNTGATPLSVGTLAISGSAAHDFALRDDTCSNHTVAPGSSCTVLVGFKPTAVGNRAAQLSVPAGGVTDTAQLIGSVPSGFSDLKASGLERPHSSVVRDYPDGALQWSSYANSEGFGFGSSQLAGRDAPSISITLPTGVRPKVGVFSTADYRGPDAWGMWVYNGGDACLGELRGLLNIKQLTLDKWGVPTSADVAFTQFCASDPADRITGEFLWRQPSAKPVLAAAALDAGTRLLAGGRLISRSRVLSLQTDGNLVLRNTAGRALWSTRTAGTGASNSLAVQTDGNLVLYAASGKALWQSHTGKSGDRHYLVLQTDGNLVLRNTSGKALWSAGTTGP